MHLCIVQNYEIRQDLQLFINLHVIYILIENILLVYRHDDVQ